MGTPVRVTSLFSVDAASSVFRRRAARDEEIVAWQPIDPDLLPVRETGLPVDSRCPANVAQGVWLSRQGMGLKAVWGCDALERKLEELEGRACTE